VPAFCPASRDGGSFPKGNRKLRSAAPEDGEHVTRAKS
jgi:hypothetical protein